MTLYELVYEYVISYIFPNVMLEQAQALSHLIVYAILIIFVIFLYRILSVFWRN